MCEVVRTKAITASKGNKKSEEEIGEGQAPRKKIADHGRGAQVIRFACNRCGKFFNVSMSKATKATTTVAEVEEITVCPRCRRLQEIRDRRAVMKVIPGGRR